MLSQNQQDDAESAVDVAEASLSVAEAAIKQAQANLLTAKVNLEYTEIRAPVDGIVGRALQNRGALVQAGSNSLLTTLVQVDPAYVDFGIPEKQQVTLRQHLKEGKLVMSEGGFIVSLVDEFGKPLGFEGQIDFQDYKVDNNTGNFAMRARVDNPDRQLSPGQFVRVRMNGMVSKQSVAIPQRAVLDGPTGKYVYIAAAGENGMQVAMQKNVVVGDWVDIDDQRKNYWIIEEGVQAGDQVIIDGMARIFFPGMPVQVDDGSGAQAAPEGQGEKPAA
jgi:membrane fusion protein (multidrug efflux system)